MGEIVKGRVGGTLQLRAAEVKKKKACEPSICADNFSLLLFSWDSVHLTLEWLVFNISHFRTGV